MADKLTATDVVDWVMSCFNEAEDGRLSSENMGEAAWGSYFNDHDFSLKEEWQTKVAVPAFGMGIDQATGAVKAALKKSVRMFTMEVLNPNDPFAVPVAKFVSDALHEQLRQADAAVVLGDGVKVNLITNIQAHKCLVKNDETTRFAPTMRDKLIGEGPNGEKQYETELELEEVTDRKPRLDIPVINPKHLFLDPTGRNLYRIHRAYKDKATLLDSKTRGLYRPLAIQSLEGSTGPSGDDDQDQERRMFKVDGSINPYRPQVEVLEYWGPVYNKQGVKVLPSRWITIFNRTHLALLEPYPFWHGSDPFVVGNLVRVPFSPYGKSLYSHVGPIGRAITDMLCMLMDASKFTTLQAFGVDTSLIEDIEELANGIFPGMTVNMTGPNAFQQLPFKGPDAGSLQILSQLLQMHQNYLGVTEFLSGAPSTRGRATATETEIKTGQSAAFFDSLAGDIEDYVFEPLLDKCYWNMIQFFDDWSDPLMQAIAAKHGLTPDMLGRSAAERYKLLKGQYRFHAVGLSSVLRRAEMLEKILRLLEVLGNRPEFLQMINANKLFEKIMEAFEFEDLVNRGNQLPPVVAGAGVAPNGYEQIPGVQGFMAPPAQGMQGLGQMLRAGASR